MGFWDRLWGKPTPDDFARIFIKRLRAGGERRAIEYDSATFNLSYGDGSGQMTFLGNAHDEYLANPRSARADGLDRFIRATALANEKRDYTPTLDEVLARLLPRVRERMFYAALPLQLELAGQKVKRFSFRPLAEHLAIGLVQDFPDHIEEMAAERFEELGLDLADAQCAALRNLELISEAPFEPMMPGFYCSPWRDNHDVARMLLLDRINSLSVRGLPVVMTPNRDWLLVTGSDDVDGLTAMTVMTRKLMEEPRFMTSIPLCLIGDQWAPFIPDEDHPLTDEFCELRVMQLSAEYDRQKHLLDSQHERDETELFVASYTGLKNPEGSVTSHCVWTRDVTTLLPRTELIRLLDLDDEQAPIMAPWAAVEEATGELMQPVNAVYPPRWRVDAFPSSSQLDAVRQIAM
jgi:hypothetical protein